MIVGIGSTEEDAWRQRVDEQPAAKDAFWRRAQSIIEHVDERRSEVGLNEALTEVHERFVDAETNQELRHFAEVVVGARRQAKLQEWLDDDREKLHHGHLGHEELTSLGHHYEALRHEACVYNHKLRSVIELSGHHFSREDLTDWLISVSQGRHEWAVGEITGAISEVALHAALQGIPELVGLRYATVEEDLAGYDFLAEFEGNLVTVDAKTGRYWPLNERKHGHRHLEISVPREAVEDFQITRRGMGLLREEIRQTLGITRGQPSNEPHQPAQNQQSSSFHHIQHSWRAQHEYAR